MKGCCGGFFLVLFCLLLFFEHHFEIKKWKLLHATVQFLRQIFCLENNANAGSQATAQSKTLGVVQQALVCGEPGVLQGRSPRQNYGVGEARRLTASSYTGMCAVPQLHSHSDLFWRTGITAISACFLETQQKVRDFETALLSVMSDWNQHSWCYWQKTEAGISMQSSE